MAKATHTRHAERSGPQFGQRISGPSTDELLEAAIAAEARKVENSAAGALADMIRMHQAHGFFQPLNAASGEKP